MCIALHYTFKKSWFRAVHERGAMVPQWTATASFGKHLYDNIHICTSYSAYWGHVIIEDTHASWFSTVRSVKIYSTCNSNLACSIFVSGLGRHRRVQKIGIYLFEIEIKLKILPYPQNRAALSFFFCSDEYRNTSRSNWWWMVLSASIAAKVHAHLMTDITG